MRTIWGFVRRKSALTAGHSILELGAGLGGLYGMLRRDGLASQYVGLELDEEAVAFASRMFGDGKFSHCGIEDFDSPRQFGAVLAFEVLEHLPNPSAAIAKISSLLGAHGVFIGTTPFPYAKNVLADGTHLSVLHPLNWKRLFQQAGFSTISLYPCSFPPYLWRLNPRFNVRLPVFIPWKYIVSTCAIIAVK
jgi:2-polyprenyl-3-methyl-5-hydroxy-6-metoxy-1,4-benzoquinol methylase